MGSISGSVACSDGEDMTDVGVCSRLNGRGGLVGFAVLSPGDSIRKFSSRCTQSSWGSVHHETSEEILAERVWLMTKSA